MALYFSLNCIFLISLLSFTTPCCKAQQADSVQIVARAALCFDNRTVTNNCTRWVGRMVTRSGMNARNTTSGVCNNPCFGQMLLVLNCLEGIFSNFQSYSPGLLQGVQSIVQMSCGGRGSINASAAGNMVAGPIEERVKGLAPDYLASLWIIFLAFGIVGALILYALPKDLCI